MALVVGTNSYVTESEANLYCADRYGYEAWEDADNKGKALISATDILDGLCIWYGEKTDPDQALEFPRYPTADPVPQAVKDAQCEIAFKIVVIGSVNTDGGDAVEELKAGDVSLKFKAKNTKNPLVSDLTSSFLQPYGACAVGSTRIISVKRG